MSKKAMKIRIKDEGHSKAVQERLFEMGYLWSGESSARVEFTDMPTLYVSNCGKITFASSDVGNFRYFVTVTDPEYILFNGELVPVEAVTEEATQIVDKPVVSDGSSSSYYALTITNKAGETIEVETGDILRALVGNDFDLSNIVKACRRMYEASQGRGKVGASVEYDANKIVYFANEFAHWNKGK